MTEEPVYTASEDEQALAILRTKLQPAEQPQRSILHEAIDIRHGSRNADYGNAVENFQKIAQMATLMTGKEITPEQCVAVQMAVKLCREGFNHKRDNLVDLCGYADIMQQIKEDGPQK